MEKWKQTIIPLLFIITLSALGSANAKSTSLEPCCDPCHWNLCEQRIDIGVDYLYWKPCVDDLDFAATVETDNKITDVKYKGICPDWEGAFRVYLNLPAFYCDWEMCLSYARVETCDSKKTTFDNPSTTEGITSPLIHPDLISANLYEEAKAHWGLCYQEWDVLFCYDTSCNRCHSLKPFFGVAGIYFKQKLHADFLSEQSDIYTVKWDSSYWGVGLKAGTEYTYRFNNCITFVAKASGALLAGEASSKNKQKFDTKIDLKDDDCCHFIPGYYIGAAAIYEGCLCGKEYLIKVGYEFLNWYNIPNHRVFYGADGNNAELSHSSSSSTRNLGFHGPLAGISVIF